MEEVPGREENTSRFIYGGYVYHQDTSSVHIFRCSTRSSSGCQGTARVDDEGNVDVYKPHEGHAPRPTILEEVRIEREMLQLAAETNVPLREIFDDVCRRNIRIAPNLLFSRMRVPMQRARARTRPNVPASLRELAEVLNTYAPTERVYRGLVEGDDGSVALMFCSDGLLQALAETSEIYVDGTFKALVRRWRRLGLTQVQSAILPMAMALPLAPAESFHQGLAVLAMRADAIADQHPPVLQFMQYLRTQWAPLAEVVSVYDCPLRTNNLVESFHKQAGRKLGGQHPNIWKFLEHLLHVIVDQELDLLRLRNGERARRGRTLRNMAKDTAIRDARLDLTVGRYTIGQFLERCATCTRNAMWLHDAEGAAAAEPEQDLVEPGLLNAGGPRPDGTVRHPARPQRRARRRLRHAADGPEGPVVGGNDHVPLENGAADGPAQLAEPVQEEEHENLYNPDAAVDGMCCACLVQPATHAFLPCGHRCCCAACAPRIVGHCPMCRTPFTEFARIY